MRAELAYLFRHVLLRDAAYQLQLPGDRSRLHALAFAVIEAQCGGRPSAPAVEVAEEAEFEPREGDAAAAELATHALLGGEREAREVYLFRAAEHAERGFRDSEAVRLWRELAAASSGFRRGESLRRAALVAGRVRLCPTNGGG